MRIIAFGDIHMTTSPLRAIPALAEADLVVFTGDLTNRGGLQEAREVIGALSGINKRIAGVAGNMDNEAVNDYLEAAGLNLHGQARLVDERLCLFGVGGSNPTPFATPWEFNEDQLHRLASQAGGAATKMITACRRRTGMRPLSILVSHAPPYGTAVDRLADGRHAGSKAIRRLIEELQPELCLCGHIHEARGCDNLGRTPLVNPGMLCRGWVEVNIHDNHITYTLL